MTDTGPTISSDPAQPIPVEPLIEPASPPADAPSVVMTEIEFHDFIGGLFPIAASVVQATDGRVYHSILNAPNLPTAGPAFSAIYRAARRSSYLRFLIEKETAWLQDMIVIGAFGSQVWMNFSQEWAFAHPVHPSQRAPGQRGAPSGIRVSPAEKHAEPDIVLGGDYTGPQAGSATVGIRYPNGVL